MSYIIFLHFYFCFGLPSPFAGGKCFFMYKSGTRYEHCVNMWDIMHYLMLSAVTS